MGAVFGVFNLDHIPAQTADLESISSQLSYPGDQEKSFQADGPVSLGQHSRFIDQEPSRLAATDGHSLLLVAVDARIDNRNELLGLFRVPADMQITVPDSWLIQQAYLKWGTRVAEHLLGDFCFAIWDKRHQTLFLCRDQFGSKTIFFYRSGRHFVFCSSLQGILAWPGIPRKLNQKALAAALIVVPIQGYSQTIYDEISVLPPGHQAEIMDNRIRISRYWNPANIGQIRFRTVEEYISAFTDLFSDAVACRLRSQQPIAALLSGGVDSGAVATEAASQLQQSGRKLATYTAVPLPSARLITGPREFGDERSLAAATSRHSGNMDSLFVDSRELSPLASIHQAVDIYRHPHFAAANCQWILAIYQQMQARGIGTVLVGQYGNATLSWPGNPSKLLRELLRAGHWDQYKREFSALRSQYNLGLARALKSYLLAPLFPWQIQARIKDTLAGPEPWHRNSAINSRFARSIGLRKEVSKSGIFAKSMHNPGFRNFLIHDGMYSINTLGAALGTPFGLDRRDPTADKRLLEFCFGIPESQYLHDGQQRLLIRRAMAGKLPDEVLWNRNYGLQSADIVWRIRQSSAEIRAALDSASRSDTVNEYLDVPRMRQVFEKALQQETVRVRLDTCNILLQGLSTAYFLDNHID